MPNLRAWVSMSGMMALVMVVGWGLMKSTAPTAEDVMRVRQLTHFAHAQFQLHFHASETVREGQTNVTRD